MNDKILNIKLLNVLLERYTRLHGGVISIKSIHALESEWQRICDSLGIWRVKAELTKELPMKMVLVKDPEPLAGLRNGMLAILPEIAEKILVLGLP